MARFPCVACEQDFGSIEARAAHWDLVHKGAPLRGLRLNRLNDLNPNVVQLDELRRVRYSPAIAELVAAARELARRGPSILQAFPNLENALQSVDAEARAWGAAAAVQEPQSEVGQSGPESTQKVARE